MLNSTGDGIVCDFCKESFTKKFVYYSCKTTQVEVDSNAIPPTKISNKSVDFDMCDKCYKLLIDNFKEG